MRVRVKLIGLPKLARAIGQSEFDVQLDGPTLGHLLRHLEASYGPQVRKDLLTAQGTVNETVQVLRNGSDWIPRDALSTSLDEGEEITFLLMMAGG
jgi:molybdopterin converting factor small subunit